MTVARHVTVRHGPKIDIFTVIKISLTWGTLQELSTLQYLISLSSWNSLGSSLQEKKHLSPETLLGSSSQEAYKCVDLLGMLTEFEFWNKPE